jgi:hypothetical protein
VSTTEVLGLTDDRERVRLRVRLGNDDEIVEVDLADIHRAERQRADGDGAPVPLTPRVIQQRIRAGESADQLAREAGWPLAAVARYEGPALAERAHHASLARRAEVDGRVVEELVAEHFAADVLDVSWDAWLVEHGIWRVEAAFGGRDVRLRWEPAARRVVAADEASRRALQQAAAEDALTAVLRPVSTSAPAAAPAAAVRPEPQLVLAASGDEELGDEPEADADADAAVDRPAVARQPRRARAEVPLWSDISLSVGGRAPSD